MIRRRSVKIEKNHRARLQSQLYRRLRKTAFDCYYQCARCGSHKDLQIHHLYYDPRNFDAEGAYQILCDKCHRKESTNHE
jgi:5-methylcytosine-specific restriction endonuclease McrA